MAKTLVLAEKPSVGREIGRVLGCRRGGDGFLEGDRYVVTWALGHLVELAAPRYTTRRGRSGICSPCPCCLSI